MFLSIIAVREQLFRKVCIVQEGVLLVWGWIVVKMIGASEVTGDGAGGLGQ